MSTEADVRWSNQMLAESGEDGALPDLLSAPPTLDEWTAALALLHDGEAKAETQKAREVEAARRSAWHASEPAVLRSVQTMSTMAAPYVQQPSWDNSTVNSSNCGIFCHLSTRYCGDAEYYSTRASVVRISNWSSSGQ